MSEQLANVWELKLSLSVVVSDDDLSALERHLWDTSEREPLFPFIWKRQGAAVTVRTQGSSLLLLQIAEWALLHQANEPTKFSVERYRSAPLEPVKGWSGHGRP